MKAGLRGGVIPRKKGEHNMNQIENTIYNEGKEIGTKICYDADGNVLKFEKIECDGVIYEFSFFNGDFTNIRRY